MEFWLALFILWSPMWWILVVATSIFIIWALEYDKGGRAAFTLGTMIAAWCFLGDLDIQVALSDWRYVAGWIGGYFVGGLIWGIIKWWLFLHNRLDEYEDKKREWLRDRDIDGTEIPKDLKTKWKEHLLGTGDRKWLDIPKYGSTGKIRVRPNAWENKSRILTWMSFWPWSLIWSLVNDFVRAIWRRIYRVVGTWYEHISKHVFRDVEDDFDD